MNATTDTTPPSTPDPATETRGCAWCKRPIPTAARRDAVTCSKRCRQARHRFIRAVLPSRPGGRDTFPAGASVAEVAQLAAGPRRLAYADPPYPGLAGYYRDHPDDGGEVDHAELIRRLSTYDGWALSTSARALPELLAITVALGVPVRVAAWHRGHRPHPGAHGPLTAWEPVIYSPAPVASGSHRDTSWAADDDASHLQAEATRRGTPARRDTSRYTTVTAHEPRTDSLVFHSRLRLSDPARVIGAKPALFAAWMFRLIGAQPSDELHDLYPGSGGIARAWHIYTGRELAPVAQLDTTRRASTRDTTGRTA